MNMWRCGRLYAQGSRLDRRDRILRGLCVVDRVRSGVYVPKEAAEGCGSETRSEIVLGNRIGRDWILVGLGFPPALLFSHRADVEDRRNRRGSTGDRD